jgi:hypothetical protein
MRNHGTSEPGLAWTASQGGSFLSGNGSSGVSCMKDRANLRITSGTITGWFQIGPTSLASTIFASYSQAGTVAGFSLGTTINQHPASLDRLSIVIGSNTGISSSHYGVWATNEPVMDSILHSFACVIRPSGEAQFWVDGVARATTLNLGTQLSPAYAASSFVCLGGEQRATGARPRKHWPGLLDDIRVYDRILTQQEIELLASRRGIGLTPLRHRRTSASSRRLYKNIGGVWKDTLPLINVAGTWKEGAVYENVGGVWKN